MPTTKKSKGLMRSNVRRGVSSGKTTPVDAAQGRRRPEPTVCEACGALFTRRTWRNDRPMTDALLARAKWTTCPACKQAGSREYFGRVLIRGAFVDGNESLIRQRVENVAARAGHTQPMRRLVSIERDGEGLEVLTTSQKLAHRIAHELKKVFRGRATYFWSDRDGSLLATWRREDTRG